MVGRSLAGFCELENVQQVRASGSKSTSKVRRSDILHQLVGIQYDHCRLICTP